MTGTVLEAIAWVTVGYMLLIAIAQTVLIAGAALNLRTHHLTTAGDRRRRTLTSPLAPRISILVPVHNGVATVVENITGLLALGYPKLEVVVVSDGSGDGTMEALKRAFALDQVHTVHREALPSASVRALYRSRDYPELLVVDKDHGGKADSLNAALNFASGEVVCIIGARTTVQPDALLLMVGPFMRHDDIVAVGGAVSVTNGCEVRHGRVTAVGTPHRFLAGAQVIEYLRAFQFCRLGWNRLGGNLMVSGAFGLFRRDAVIGIGGYETGSVGEDMELVVALRRRARRLGTPGRVDFVPDPVASTEVPVKLRELGRQRSRWHRGLIEVMRHHAGMIGNPREGALGMVVAPYFLFVEFLGPWVEALGLATMTVGVAVGAVDPQLAVLFFLVAYGYGILLNLVVVMLEQAAFDRYRGWRHKAWLLLWAIAESVLFRPLNLPWRLHGVWRYVRGERYGAPHRRRRFHTAAAPTDSSSV